jgi:hypothetical protein
VHSFFSKFKRSNKQQMNEGKEYKSKQNPFID